ncbi:MAG: HutD/Ves family protein [Steroidobacteraceae bacterium]
MRRPAGQLLRYESYRAMPWRNGRGSTLEIARGPAAGEEFAWRLSLADIQEDTDFSAYPGYSRALVLVDGPSLHLRFRGHGHRFLDSRRRSARFEGDWQTHCTVPQGRCTDLSLIVRRARGMRPATAVRAPTVLHLRTTRRMVLSEGLHAALFVLDGSVAIVPATRSRPRTVRARQTLLLPPGPRRILSLRSLGGAPAQLVMLRWRPASMSSLVPPRR